MVVAPALAMRAGLRALLSARNEVEVIGEAASLADLFKLPPETDVLIVVVEAAEGPEPKSFDVLRRWPSCSWWKTDRLQLAFCRR
jgi:DNA-binding NarL/FixJ family response regulator